MKKQPKRRGPEFYRYLARLTAPIALQNLIIADESACDL